MSIVKLAHVSLIAPSEDHVFLVQRLQEFGQLHIEGISRFQAEKTGRLLEALNFLIRSKVVLHQELTDPDLTEEALVDKTLTVRDRLQEYRDKKEFLEERIKDVTPWGNIDYDTLAKVPGYRFWYYQVPHYQMKSVKSSSLNWAIVNKDLRFSYIVVVSKDEPPSTEMPVPRTHMGSVSLKKLIEEKHQTEVLIEKYYLERQQLTVWIQWLLKNRADDINEQHLNQAHQAIQSDNQLCQISGWLPKKHLDDLVKLCEENRWALSYRNPQKGDTIPTLMKNPKPLTGGEDLTSFYQTPSYDSWDPSIVLFFSFSAFFSMILADAGYAFILLVILLLTRKQFKKSTALRRLSTLLMTIVGLSITYGVMCGSYFGVAPNEGVLKTLAIIDLNNYDLMINLTLVIGVLHILLANGITCWRYGLETSTGKLYAGWMVLILSLSGLYFFPLENIIPILSSCAAISALIIIWYGGDTSENSATTTSKVSIIKRVLLGLTTLTDVTKLFGDVLSYLRLFALGLASAALAVTFNQLGSDASNSIPFWGNVIAFAIWIFGHSLNFILGIMSGVVHGLRLNFIEFYHWSLSDEGYPFHAFKKHEVKPWKPYS